MRRVECRGPPPPQFGHPRMEGQVSRQSPLSQRGHVSSGSAWCRDRVEPSSPLPVPSLRRVLDLLRAAGHGRR
eukprot:4284080-Pyramimonas_sp.AAC.1